MEEQIFRIIEKNYNSETGIIYSPKASKEIAEHFEKFMEWAVRKEMLQYSGSAEEWQTTYCGNFLNIKELYSYWLNNIDNK